ncbi:hypothetical protein GPALN_015014 [Globodera pallida]|nr:hypothetical protein GPALN_015014 [Globodera pallida]
MINGKIRRSGMIRTIRAVFGCTPRKHNFGSINKMSAASIDGVLLLVVVVLLHPPALLGQKLGSDRADLDTLKFVHALWRLGDRTPTKMIPSDQTNTLDKRMPRRDWKLPLLPRSHAPILFGDVECPAASKAEDELFSSDDFKKGTTRCRGEASVRHFAVCKKA